MPKEQTDREILHKASLIKDADASGVLQMVLDFLAEQEDKALTALRQSKSADPVENEGLRLAWKAKGEVLEAFDSYANGLLNQAKVKEEGENE